MNFTISYKNFVKTIENITTGNFYNILNFNSYDILYTFAEIKTICCSRQKPLKLAMEERILIKMVRVVRAVSIKYAPTQ